MAFALVALAAASGVVRVGRDAAAQTSASPPTRVVFAIDNSGSMFGVGGEPASDPDQQRIAGVQGLIGVLQGFLGAPGEERAVELGALSFGGGQPAVLSELANVLDGRLADRLRAEPIGGGTDFRAALCGAWTLAAREAPPPDAGCPEPSPEFLGAAGVGSGRGSDAADARLLVVLITDGSPAAGSDDLPFDGDPPPGECPGGFGGYGAADGDAYLCSLADTWRVLRAQHTAELAVIGLDEPGQWFPSAEPYWQRVAQCGSAGQPDCSNRVVRSVDPGELAGWILRTFPGVDLCEAIRGETFSCDVPGGLVSVRFQVVGLAGDSTSTVRNPDRVSYDSTNDPGELTRLDETTHMWSFERPGAGDWSLTGGAAPGQLARVIVHPDPARFDIALEQWDDHGMVLALTLHPTSTGRVALASLLTQPYRVELLRDGSIAGDETVRLEHAGREAFTLTAASFGPPGGDDATYEVALYLRTLLVGRFSVAEIPPPPPTPPPSSTATATPTATPTPTPTATPPPPPACSAEWEGDPGEAPRWRPTVRFGFPLPIRFRDSAVWSATIGPAECADFVEAEADVPGCAMCSARDEGPPPLTLDVPTAGLSGDPGERRVSWYAPASGVEDASTETVRLADALFLRTEPYWATVLHAMALALIAAGVSALAVRLPHAWRSGDEPAPPVELSVPDERHREVGIVRLGTLVWRRTARDEGRDDPGRLLTLRWLVFGPLVARDTSEGAPRRALWLGEPTAEAADAETRRLDIRRSRSPRTRS